MSALARLADRAGIAPGYHDIGGTWHSTGDETRRRLLAALGMPADDEAAAADALVALEAADWADPLPTAHIVAAETQPGAVPLVLTGGQRSGTLAWRLEREDGSQRAGEIAAVALAEVARHDGLVASRRLLPLPEVLAEGYHRLSLDLPDGTSAATTLMVCPRRGWSVAEAAGEERPRLWGLACQLYGLRGAEDGGIGTFAELADLARAAGAHGADLIGLNPLHALFPAAPQEFSPYSPASRDFLTILAIDPTQVPDFAECEAARALHDAPAARARRAALRAQPLVDYPAVTDALLPVLRALWDSFRARHLDGASPRSRAFQAFRAEGGGPLRRIATFFALQEEAVRRHGPDRAAWPTWPEPWRAPDSPDVAIFAMEHADRIGFHDYCQWIADEQLAAAAQAGREAGLRLGLYRDLAVGVGPASAAAWASPEALVRGAAIGAPPDLFNPRGQDWGLVPLDPRHLAGLAYQPFLTALRANMRHAGALRIDHAMGLTRQFWVPEGCRPDQGAYVAFPFEALRRLLALESRRNRCVAIGEDLGTVPDGFRAAMADSGALSYRVLSFERVEGGLFARPATYPDQAVVTAATHDLPTVAGFWSGRDLAWRRDLALYPSPEMAERDAADRRRDRRRLIDALIDAGVWPAEPPTDADAQPCDAALLAAIHRFLARTPSQILMVQMEDLAGLVEQANLPSTLDEHPNWRRRLPAPTEELLAGETAQAVLAALAEERPRSL